MGDGDARGQDSTFIRPAPRNKQYAAMDSDDSTRHLTPACPRQRARSPNSFTVGSQLNSSVSAPLLPGMTSQPSSLQIPARRAFLDNRCFAPEQPFAHGAFAPGSCPARIPRRPGRSWSRRTTAIGRHGISHMPSSLFQQGPWIRAPATRIGAFPGTRQRSGCVACWDDGPEHRRQDPFLPCQGFREAMAGRKRRESGGDPA